MYTSSRAKVVMPKIIIESEEQRVVMHAPYWNLILNNKEKKKNKTGLR